MANTTEDKLAYLDGTKDTLKTNLIAKGMDVTDETPFRKMAQMVADIASGGYVEGASYNEIAEKIGDVYLEFVYTDLLVFIIELSLKDDANYSEKIVTAVNNYIDLSCNIYIPHNDDLFELVLNQDAVTLRITSVSPTIGEASIDPYNGVYPSDTEEFPFNVSMKIIDLSRPI